jgi:two-component system response regulator DevR
VPPNGEQIRVYLVDDHDLVRRGLRDLLAAARDIIVVGESSSAAVAPDLILALDTDVMVLDLHLQDGTGAHVCRRVRSTDPSVRGVLLTASGDDEAATAAILAGAVGYTTKYARSSDLVGTIRAVAAGHQLMDETLRNRAAARVLSYARELRPPIQDDGYQILALMTEGLTDHEIAERLGGEPSAIADRISTLIDRMTHPAPFAAPSQPEPGRHRADGS